MSERGTGRFLQTNDGNLNKDARQFSFGQPEPFLTNRSLSQQNKMANYYSFAQPQSNYMITNNGISARTTTDQRANIIPQSSIIIQAPIVNRQSQIPPSQYNMIAPSPQSQVNAQYQQPQAMQYQTPQVVIKSPPPSNQLGKMNIMHRPEVYSGNFETLQNTHKFNNPNKSLGTVKQQRQSSYQSRQTQTQNIVKKSVQGYNLSELQIQEYQRQKQLQRQAKCCFLCKK